MDPSQLYARHAAESHDHGAATEPAAALSQADHTDNNMSGSSHSMMSIFQTSMATSLYSEKWTPNSAGTYAATCIFLVVLAVLFRGLLALKLWQENRWLEKEMKRRYVVVNGKLPLAENLSRDSLAKNVVLSENGVEENVVVVQRPTTHARPWRLTIDPLRAVADTVIAGVGYLLMLAVMTMNIGYFLSVLAGTFVGSLLVGRFISTSEH